MAKQRFQKFLTFTHLPGAKIYFISVSVSQYYEI